MRGISQVIMVTMGLVLCFGVLPAETKQPDVQITDDQKDLAGASNRFGFRLFQEVVTNDGGDGNVFISPLSVSYALAMTLNGAVGKTRDDIISTLELKDLSAGDISESYKNLTSLLTGLDPSVTFEIANSIWYRSGLPVSRDFIKTNRDNFGAQVRDLDFSAPSAADIINKWVNDNTKGKIENIINPPIDPSSIMFLINAIYFKGTWATQFEPAATRDHPFYPAEGKEVKCRMMFNTEKFDYFENDLFQAISLPYGKKGFDMMVFLPRSSSTLGDLIDRLDDQNWAIWEKGYFKTKVELGLPRFKFQYDVTMNKMLKAMGMEIAFDGQKADFGKMIETDAIPGQNIFIDRVKHKTFLQVDEEGTEAAAVTSVTMALTSAMPAPIPVMIIDRPFLFAIRERNSGSIVFIGQVTDPVWEE